MDFIDKINNLAQKIERVKDSLSTEEATKTAIIMPFITALGYDVFDPIEVIPEYTCDIPGKKQEKIDYCIQIDNAPTILIECKPNNSELNIAHASQLFRYFVTSQARFAILTNGVIYQFYTDLEKPNVMDDKPFFEINLLDIKENSIEELKKFHKNNYNTDLILATASDLKYTNSIKNVLLKQLISPDDDVIKLLAGKVYEGPKTQSVIEQFNVITKKAFQLFVNDKVNERLKNALGETALVSVAEEAVNVDEKDIETTDEELQAYYIIKAIASEIVSPERIAIRDVQNYCTILFDNNNRKPIAKLYFNNPDNLRISFERETEKISLASINEIFSHAGRIKDIVNSYLE